VDTCWEQQGRKFTLTVVAVALRFFMHIAEENDKVTKKTIRWNLSMPQVVRK